MRTENDLHAALAARADLAPEPASVLIAVHQVVARRRRRRNAAGIVAAAVAATLAIGIPAVTRQYSGTGQDATAPTPAAALTSGAGPGTPQRPVARPPFSFTVSPGLVAGFVIEPTAVSPDLQLGHISRPGSATSQAMLYLYQPGGNVRAGWDVSQRPVSVTVNGATGFYSTSAGASAIRWEYLPGGWAVIVEQAKITKQTLVTIAEGIRFVDPYPAKVPYRLSYLPTDLRVFNVAQQITGTPHSVVQLESYPVTARARIFNIGVDDGSATSRPDWRPNATIAGHSAHCTTLVDGQRCALDFGEFTVDVGSDRLDRAELTRLVSGMSFASWRDPTTWYDIDVAIPQR